MVEHKYLGCIINEYAESLSHGKVMVNYRAKAGARALCAWLRKCTIAIGEVKGESFMRLLEALVDSVLLYAIAIGEVKGESFMRLLEALVDSVLLYGTEAWGCCRQKVCR